MPAGDDLRRNALILSRIVRLRRRLNSEVALRTAIVPLWIAVTAFAVFRLLVHSHLLVAAALGVSGFAGAWGWRFRRIAFTTSDAAILLDRASGSGGLLLTRLERTVGGWELSLNDRVRVAPLPPVARARHGGLVLLAFVFLAASSAIPVPNESVRPINAAAASRVAEVESRAEALAEETELPPQLEVELARLRAELVAGSFDAADWEAVDHLDEALAREAAEAAAALARAAEAAKALEDALAQAQSRDEVAREVEALERALMDVKGDAPGAAAGPTGGRPSQAQAGADGRPGSAEATREGAGELRRALEQRRERLARAFGEQGSASGPLAQRTGRPSREGRGEGDGRGRPGVARGGGPGELQFNEDAQVDPDRLAFSPLPPGQGGDEPQELWGLQAADPSRPSAPAGRRSGPTHLDGVAAGAHDQSALLPRNRDVVRRYFETQPRPETP